MVSRREVFGIFVRSSCRLFLIKKSFPSKKETRACIAAKKFLPGWVFNGFTSNTKGKTRQAHSRTGNDCRNNAGKAAASKSGRLCIDGKYFSIACGVRIGGGNNGLVLIPKEMLPSENFPGTCLRDKDAYRQRGF